jgi:prevent-host-death family protein
MAGMKWQLQEAKNRLSEVVKAAKNDGPQIITVHGKEEVAVVSMAELRKLKQRKLGRPFWESAPKVKLDIARSKDPGRDTDFR